MNKIIKKTDIVKSKKIKRKILLNFTCNDKNDLWMATYQFEI